MGDEKVAEYAELASKWPKDVELGAVDPSEIVNEELDDDLEDDLNDEDPDGPEDEDGGRRRGCLSERCRSLLRHLSAEERFWLSINKSDGRRRCRLCVNARERERRVRRKSAH